MKKLLCVIAILFASLVSYSQGFSENDTKSMKPIVKTMWEAIDLVETTKGYEIVHIEFDIIKSEPKECFRVLTYGYTYRAYLVGETGKAEDMDIEVWKRMDDGTYQLVIKDTKTESTAIVDFQPTSSGWYKFIVKCYKFAPGWSGCHWGLMILHE